MTGVRVVLASGDDDLGRVLVPHVDGIARDVAALSGLFGAVVLLDVRLGGSASRVVEQMPALAAAHCAVVVMTRAPRRSEIDEAALLGAYDVLDRASDDEMRRCADVIASARSWVDRRLGRARASSGRRAA